MRQALVVKNLVVNVIEAPAGFDCGDGSQCVPSNSANVGDAYTHGVFSIPPAEDLQLTVGLNFLQFMALFSPAEQAAIVNSNDPQVKLFNLMAAGAPSIDLSDPQVVMGVGYLAQGGLIAADRIAVILSGAPPA